MLDRVRRVIQTTMEGWKATHTTLPLWREPLVGCASAEDPLFRRLKEVVSTDHLMPQDILHTARSVIVYFLPFLRQIGKDNAQSHPRASRLWAQAYIETNTLIAAINERIASDLRRDGYQTVVTPATHNFDTVTLISHWSHKHVAYIAGLGSFGLHHLLITSLGCCGRLGSLVTDAVITPTERPGIEHCLVKRGKSCGQCITRCPVGALERGIKPFDRQRCYAQLLANDRFYDDLPLVDVCGQCSSEVPCSYGTPSSHV